MPEPVFIKLGMYSIMATESIIHPSNLSMYPYVNPFTTARQWLNVNVAAATNTHGKVEELLEESFPAPAVTYRRNTRLQFFPELLVCRFLSLFLK
jgi:hypothetical protein